MNVEQFYLGKLASVSSDIIRIALEAQQHGLDDCEYLEAGDANRYRLHFHLDDLLAVVDELNRYCELGFSESGDRQDDARTRVRESLARSVEAGKVQW